MKRFDKNLETHRGIALMIGNHPWICMVYGPNADPSSEELKMLACLHNEPKTVSPLMPHAIMAYLHVAEDDQDAILCHIGEGHEEPLRSAAGLRCMDGHFVSAAVDTTALTGHTSYPFEEITAGIAMYAAVTLGLFLKPVALALMEHNTYFTDVVQLHL